MSPSGRSSSGADGHDHAGSAGDAMYYPGVPHEQLKQWATRDTDPSIANDVAASWQDIGCGMVDAARRLASAVTGSVAGRTGPAADQARRHLADIGQWSGRTGSGFQLAAGILRRQALAAEHARTMPDPVPYQPEQTLLEVLVSGDLLRLAELPVAMPAQFDRSQAAHRRAVEIMHQRDSILRAADAGTLAGQWAVPPPVGDE